MNTNSRIYEKKRYIMLDMTRVTYKVTLRLSQSFKDKRLGEFIKDWQTETLEKTCTLIVFKI